ncbi:MAG: hypothetical protein LBB76_10340 [Azoarcus sp.]|jgi:hypothetical protein|nr:hypothetical protein [Azoarcus sp.]
MILKPRFAILALFVFFVAGCATVSNIGKTPEEIVAARSTARWQAIIGNDWKTAYQYTTPAFRETLPQEQYQGFIGATVIRKSAEAVKVKCEEATACDVTVRMAHEPVMIRVGEIVSNFPERWVEVDGEWYIYHRR